jgi:fatty acid desaturase
MSNVDIENPEGAESIQFSSKTPRLPARFRVKSDRYGWFLTARSTVPFLAVLVLIPLLDNNLFMWIFAGVMCGWSAYRIQFVLHDTCHMSLFSSRKTNDLVGISTGLLIGNYFKRYRAIHFLHHKYNGLIEDPQLPDYLSDRQMNKKAFLKFIFEPLWGMRLIPYLRRDLIEADIVKAKIPSPTKSWYFFLFILQIAIVFYATSGLTRPMFFLSIYGGMATFSLFLARLRTLAEHQQVDSSYSDFSRTHKRNWFDTLMLQDANFCYHLEHHLYPSVQSRHLPDLLSELTEDLHTVDSRGTSMFRTLSDSYRKLPSSES